ncbi:hypothetical protein T4B_2146 [Trichinella pseudospiralis]|uniref:Uncharacterized protein n=2 Tax=Trichinella pseudospiralis TaxID=6337 RepID=A0A0V1HMT6_TRIPS|nr:hypothetical protein T4A_10407 [Trichinella pseudospiralis]KRZ11426.1 hypothetical protein T4B_2146 [Trichinella pseudospiralis]KRZ44350.1 hypothetical protein T4C_13059 [Trichinella pseudospiralis]
MNRYFSAYFPAAVFPISIVQVPFSKKKLESRLLKLEQSNIKSLLYCEFAMSSHVRFRTSSSRKTTLDKLPFSKYA